MIRFLLRFVGLLLLALGFIFLVYDGIRSISDGSILLTRTSEVWNVVHDRSLAALQVLVERHAGPDIWQILAQILEQPASAAACILGVILIVLGRKKKPLIGYARD
jgi:hypothetical protein